MPDKPAGDVIRTHLLRVMGEVAAPLSTADLRQHLADQLHGHIVNETVYRSLCILERRKEVERLPRAGRHTLWVPRL